MRIQACTVIGCTDSDLVSLSTAQLPPAAVEPPELFVYGKLVCDYVSVHRRVIITIQGEVVHSA